MHQSFKEEHLAHSFENDGFVILPLLEKKEIDELIEFYQSMDHNYKTGYGFHISMDDDKPEFIEYIHQKIISICQPKLKHFFNDIQAFSGRFLIKEPNRHSIVTPHQDWSFVDEEEYSSAIVWLSLVDVDINNGALGVLKGSHKLKTGYRASPLPIFEAPYKDYSYDLFPFLELEPMKAGEAMIMNNCLIHGSPPNIGKKDRLVVGFEIASKEAPLVHYHLSKKNGKHRILKYAIDETFFYHYSNSKLKELYGSETEISDYECIGELEYNREKWEEKKFWLKMGTEENFSKNLDMKALFDYSFGHRDEVPEFGKQSPTSLSKPKKNSFIEVIKSFLQKAKK